MDSKKLSETLNDLRLFPRVFAVLFILMVWDVASWYMELPSPGIEQSGFASTVIATSAAYFKFYVGSGNKLLGEKDAEK